MCSPIDMFTPAQACAELRVDQAQMLQLVNAGRLPAFNVGGHIRFRVRDVIDVQALTGELARV